jgi:hypothetical protein
MNESINQSINLTTRNGWNGIKTAERLKLLEETCTLNKVRRPYIESSPILEQANANFTTVHYLGDDMQLGSSTR